jgi:isopenicillin N synthase-like dioxygenase
MSASAEIPIIDLSGDQHQVAKQLVDAAEEHGFIYIRNLGKDISAADIDAAFKLVRPSHPFQCLATQKAN